MNWKSIVIGTDPAGKVKLMQGPEVSPEAQRAYLAGFLNGKDLPKGIEKLELVTRARGVVKTAALRPAETPEDRVLRDLRGMTHEAMLKELEKPTAKQKADKSLAEAALVAQRLNEPASPSAKEIPEPTDPDTDDGADLPAMGNALPD